MITKYKESFGDAYIMSSPSITTQQAGKVSISEEVQVEVAVPGTTNQYRTFKAKYRGSSSVTIGEIQSIYDP